MNALYRIDDRCWAFVLPKWDDFSENDPQPDTTETRIHGERYDIIQIARNIIDTLGLEQLKIQTTQFHIPCVRTLLGKWKISIIEPNTSCLHRFWQWIPFTHRLKNRRVIDINVDKESDSLMSRIFYCFRKATTNCTLLSMSECDVTRMRKADFHSDNPLEKRLREDPFSDAFTITSTDAFQHWENEWTNHSHIRSKYQLLLRDNEVLLEPNHGPPETLVQEQLNRKTVLAYKKFIIEEYGQEFLRRLQYRYEFDLDELITAGDPLLPEHVWRVNIGVNDIEQRDVDIILEKLKALRKALEQVGGKTGIGAFFESYQSQLTVREMRNLLKQLSPSWQEKMPTVKELKEFLGFVVDDQKTLKSEDLDIEAFNKVLSILRVPAEALDNVFTGRKIVHLPIMGYYTVAKRKSFKPALDHQESLQIFADCEKEDDWTNFFELASHVLSKKHFIRTDPDTQLQVGALVPGPKTPGGLIRWYRFDSCCDDDIGDFNYTLVPAHRSDDMPHIKLYRSTASDPYQLNGYASLQADLRLMSAPGKKIRLCADEYELPFFKERTIPLWIGYLLRGNELFQQAKAEMDINRPFDQDLLQKRFRCCAKTLRTWQEVVIEYEKGVKLLLKFLFWEYKEAIEHRAKEAIDGTPLEEIPSRQRAVKHALEELTEEKNSSPYVPDIVSQETIEVMKETVHRLKTHAELCAEQLTTLAQKLGELPENKIACDIAFVGHSLGGALAQCGLFHFGPEFRRIPLPGHRYLCYTSDAPAIAEWEANRFMKFGHKHQNLLEALEQKWSIFHQMEYGDFVPQGGDSHLGATSADPKTFERWLQFNTRVFQPLETAETKEVCDSATHGRRIGLAKEDLDYKLTLVTSAGLARYDHAWLLTPQLQAVWGYRLLNSPSLSKWLQRRFSAVTIPLSSVARKIYQIIYPTRLREFRDANGVLFCSYQHPLMNSWVAKR